MSKKVTIFGAGLVVKPMVDYLSEKGYELTVASRTLSKAEELVSSHSNANAKQFLIDDEDTLIEFVKNSDLIVSLLPASMHVKVAKKCIEYKTNMVTTSYISPEMKKLDVLAKEAGVIILNEIGVDPGIDHMSAMKIFDEVRGKGGEITSFMSYCGGLPAPRANKNPYGYKFSWAPKGVLLAARNDAKYLKDGKIVEVDGKDLFSHYWLVDVDGFETLEAYPNRDSLRYIDIYGLQGIKTMYRGTFRNISHCDTWLSLSKLAFFNNDDVYENLSGTVREFILEKMLNEPKDADLRSIIAKKLGLYKSSLILKKFKWLGLFDDSPLPIKKGAPIDLLTALMQDRLSYKKNERDLLVMHHQFEAKFKDKTQKITSTLIDYGIPDGDSSMARTVSLPAAIGVRMILEGKIQLTGVHMPIIPEIYEPVLTELENLDIKLEEKYY